MTTNPGYPGPAKSDKLPSRSCLSLSRPRKYIRDATVAIVTRVRRSLTVIDGKASMDVWIFGSQALRNVASVPIIAKVPEIRAILYSFPFGRACSRASRKIRKSLTCFRTRQELVSFSVAERSTCIFESPTNFVTFSRLRRIPSRILSSRQIDIWLQTSAFIRLN